jgi:hypothetical protein
MVRAVFVLNFLADSRGKQKGREVTAAGSDAVRRDANDGNSWARRFATSNPH